MRDPLHPSRDTPDPDEARAGRVLSGKYRLVRRLGGGGMAVVYEARHVWTRRKVALKILRREFATRQDAVRRFFQEARATARIAHPNIVDVLDMGSDDDGTLYLVQEFLEGRDLDEHLERAPNHQLPLGEALDVLIPMMGALAAAHERGIVHRDLKPANVLLATSPTGEITPKVIDFGISKIIAPAPGGSAAGGDESNVIVRTHTGMIVGTPAYMSPEQVNGRRDLDARTDVWAMGVILYELLAGVRPFDGESSNTTMIRIVTEEPRPIAERVPGLPVECTTWIGRSLAKEPGRRFPTMREQLESALRIPVAAPGAAAGSPAPFEARQRQFECSLRAYPVDEEEEALQAREEAMSLETILSSSRLTTGMPARTRWPLLAVATGSLAVLLVLAWVARSKDSPLPPSPPLNAGVVRADQVALQRSMPKAPTGDPGSSATVAVARPTPAADGDLSTSRPDGGRAEGGPAIGGRRDTARPQVPGRAPRTASESIERGTNDTPILDD